VTSAQREQLDFDHETMRRKLWIKTAVAIAGAFGVSEFKVAASWADKALDAFDERFKSQAKIWSTKIQKDE
jgi:hypothetical protein